MTNNQHGQVPESLRLAEEISNLVCSSEAAAKTIAAAADELCRLHVENASLRAQRPASPPAEQQATKETSGGFHVWRDISTAPKDGSRFVATGHNYGLYSEVRHTCVAQWFRGCWMEVSDWNETSELKYLTHWMPLPSPPDDVAAPADSVQEDAATPTAQAEGWVSVQDELPKCSKKPDSFGVEVLIWPPHEDGSRTAFYGRRQSREPNFYKYGALLGHVEFWRYPPPPPTSAEGVEHG